LYFTIINPEATMLTCLRSLLLSVSIIIDAIDYMKTDALGVSSADTGSITLLPEEINEAIVYILHYGRPLYKGEGEEPQPGEFANTTSVTSASNNSPTITTTTTTSTTTSTTTATKPPMSNRTDIPADDYRPQSNNMGQNNSQNNFDNDVENENEEEEAGSDEDTGIALILPGTRKAPPVDNGNSGGVSGNSGGNSGSSAPASPSGGAGNADSADLTGSEEELLKLKPDDFSDSNLPPGFDPAPAKPVYVKGSTQEQYKAYMVSKYEYETWENKLILYKIKVKKQIEELKAKKGIK